MGRTLLGHCSTASLNFAKHYNQKTMNLTKAAQILDIYIKSLFDNTAVITIKSISKDGDSVHCKFTVIFDMLITMKLSMSISNLQTIEIALEDR